MARVGKHLEGDYEALKEQIRRSPAVYADETSWWVGGPGWWLWDFTTPEETVYVVEHCRGQQIVNDMLGEHFGGTLVSDCLSSYDPIECDKHKCYSHHLRAIADAMKRCPSSGFLRRVQALLKLAMVWRDQRGAPGYWEIVHGLERWADELLTPFRADPEEERVANRLRKRRAYLFTFLYKQEVEPTNNRAERQLRPAVIARKVSCGNKTVSGKHTWEILASLSATCQQRDVPFPDFVAAKMPLLNRPP